MQRDFDEWFKHIRRGIATYNYYVDFAKVYKNLDKVKVELNILNSLIGEKNIESKFSEIVLKYPETLECIPLILAIRSNEVFVKDEVKEYLFKFDKMVYSMNDYIKFMRETGLFELLQNHIINNLYDYVLGVEVGSDSNTRKNRIGDIMEDLVEGYIKKAGFERNKDYFKEMSVYEIEEKWGVNLDKITGDKTSTKRFDFVIKTDNQIYVIETNFYASSGSKLNETARSYKMLALEAKDINGVTFIWFTDGFGWKNAKNNLKETFNVMEHLYNIHDLDMNILDKIIK